MIFSPVTAGLYSLNILGRMVMAWISIMSRTVELLARIMTPNEPLHKTTMSLTERRHTVALMNDRDLISERTAPIIEGQCKGTSLNVTAILYKAFSLDRSSSPLFRRNLVWSYRLTSCCDILPDSQPVNFVTDLGSVE
jgi:hypothetical protein